MSTEYPDDATVMTYGEARGIFVSRYIAKMEAARESAALDAAIDAANRRPAGRVEDDRRTCLYRHYDADGTLLYVGISHSFESRTSQHRGAAIWRDFVDRSEAEWHGSRPAARESEVAAISAEAPLFNRADASDPTFRAAVKYLFDKGRHDMLDVRWHG
jgi:predicted GIY-YIG superfamily endonuclease